MSRFALIVIALTSACYSPTPGDCAYSCANAVGCPAGLSCNAGMCRAAGATGACAIGDGGNHDGREIDALAFDAPTSCGLDNITYINVTRANMNSPGAAWTVSSNQTYDTDTGASTGGAPPIGRLNGGTTGPRFILVSAFSMDPTKRLTISGSTPLIIASTTKIEVQGTIKWAPFKGIDIYGNCPSPSGNGQGSCATGGGAGGTGSTLGGVGGAGGTATATFGLPDAGIGSNASAGGTPGMTLQDGTLSGSGFSGGCQGGAAGAIANGAGGGGGGGLELVAPSVVISGGVSVAGGGGDPGATASCAIGGAGGGAGGGLLIDSCAVSTLQGSVLCAAGGGGGGGGSVAGSPATKGLNGDSGPGLGSEPFGCNGGNGGMGGVVGNGGGNGGGLMNPGAPGGSPNTTMFPGGGGGGGAGRIRVSAGYFQSKGLVNPRAVP